MPQFPEALLNLLQMDFALFLLIILAFYNSGKFLTHKLWRIKFTGSGEAILFPVALGSIVISGIMTALLFLGWIKSETCWVVLGVLLLLGWKQTMKTPPRPPDNHQTSRPQGFRKLRMTD